MATIIFPLLRIWPASARIKVMRTRRCLGASFSLFFLLLRILGLIRLEVKNREKLQINEPCLILANHPSLLDVVAVISRLSTVNCIVKEALWQNPLLKKVVISTNYISNKNHQDLINLCVSSIKSGDSLMIFPEGTRSDIKNGIKKFQRGAATIAIKADCPIIPLFLSCDPPTLGKGQKWYDIPPHPPVLRIDVGEAIDVNEFVSGSASSNIASRRLTAFLENLYKVELYKT